MTNDGTNPASPDEPVTPAVPLGKPPKPVSQQVGRLAMFVAGGVFVVFALVNAQYVDFSWVFGSTEVLVQGTGSAQKRISGGVPLIVLLMSAFALGGIVGAGLQARHHAKKAARPSAATKADRKKK